VKDKFFTELLTFKGVFMASILFLIAMIVAIVWLLRDDAIFWGDCERAAKNLPTKKYFKK